MAQKWGEENVGGNLGKILEPWEFSDILKTFTRKWWKTEIKMWKEDKWEVASEEQDNNKVYMSNATYTQQHRPDLITLAGS